MTQKPTINLYRILLLIFGAVLVLSIYGCSDSKTDEENTSITDNSILISGPGENGSIKFSSSANESISKIQTDIAFKDLQIHVPVVASSWCTASLLENKELKISVTPNTTDNPRETSITIYSGSQNETVLQVIQEGFGFLSNKKVPVLGVKADSEQYTSKEDERAEKMIDGDYMTHFNSKYGELTGNDWPFKITFDFDGDNTINYLTSYPRQNTKDNGWGAFGKLDIYVATKTQPELTKVGEYDFEEKLRTPTTVVFKTPLIDVTQIQFRVKTAYKNRVSCAEVEFFELADYDNAHVFTDKTCSELKKGTSKEEIMKLENSTLRDIALQLYDGTYDSEFRVQSYRPYQHPDIKASLNRTSPHSLRDNPTGIYVTNTGEKLVVFVGDSDVNNLSLEICNLKPEINSEYHSLLPGINIIEPKMDGLIYIHNHTEDNIPLPIYEPDYSPEVKKIIEDKTVKIHFVGGYINGYFDVDKHDNKFWEELIWGDKYGKFGDMDVIGHYSHTRWSVEHYKEYNTKDIITIIDAFDTLVHSQNEFTGLVKYNKEFNNRAFMHIIYTPNPKIGAYSTAYRTAYNYNGYANIFCTIDGFKNRLWVVGHEVGHSNQVRPGFRWHGTTEITNNLYALYNQEVINGRSVRLYDGNPSPFDDGQANFINGNLAWSQRDSDTGEDDLNMARLVPLWQLKLYFVDILEQRDFYKDFYEHCRKADYSFVNNTNHGELMLDFIRQVCRIGNQNMLEFFEKWGFLRPFKQNVKDYSYKVIEVTEEQINALREEIESMNYPKPQIPVHEITDYNWPDFKNKLK